MLIIAGKLNIQANELVGNTTGKPIDSHIDTAFVIYINTIYHPNKYKNKLTSTSG